MVLATVVEMLVIVVVVVAVVVLVVLAAAILVADKGCYRTGVLVIKVNCRCA